MFDRIRLSRLITLALASCAVTWAFSAGALARPDTATTTTTTTSAPVYKAVQGDVDKAPSASTAPAYQPAIGDSLKTPDRAAVDANLANLARGGKTPGVTVASTGDDNTDTIALITAIAAMLVALGAVTFIVVRPQRPVLRA
jgi:hypothetical protein